MKYVIALICIFVLASNADARPRKFRHRRQPTPVAAQDQLPAKGRERSIVAPALRRPTRAPIEFRAGDSDLTPDETRLLVGLNRLRASRGKPPVAIDPVLMQVCHERVDTLLQNNPHASNQFGGAARHAARYASWSGVNDVVAAGYWSDGSKSSPESSVDGWRQSDGHLRCILGQSNINNRWIDQGYDRVGVARGRRFDIAVFGRR